MKALKSFFKFYRKERNGILVLFVFILAIQCYLYINEYGSSEEILLVTNKIETTNEAVDSLAPITKLFYFDPNQLKAKEAKKLGITDKQFNNLLNYRKAGGYFNKASDISKLYTFDESLCEQLIPYIRLNNKIRAFSIELNTATEKDFEKIRGVGKKLAQRIVRFRKALGGFTDKKQLYEVYGLEPRIVDKHIADITLDKTKVNYLALNKASEKELKKHPYISLADAKAIIAYREKNGMFTHINGIDQIDVIPSEKLKKIKPYLIVE